MKTVFISLLMIVLSAAIAFSQEESEYRRFKLEDASCDVGLRYKNTPEGLMVGVSALATGKGVEFRKWRIASIKLRMGQERFKPDREGKFYVTEESLWRVPAAIVFAAIGAFGEYGGGNFNNNFSKVAVGLGLGLIALQAKGEITGERCIFNIPADKAGNIEEGRDYIEITVENENLHVSRPIKVGLIKPAFRDSLKYDYELVSQKDLMAMVDSFKMQITALEEEQSSYKYGQDVRYDELQRKIERLETERGMAYKRWLERQQEGS